MLALVYRYVAIFRQRAADPQNKAPISKVEVKEIPPLILTDEELKKAEDYFYRKATLEVKQLVPQTKLL